MPGKSTYSGKLYTVIFESKDVSSQNIRKIISEIQPVKSEEKIPIFITYFLKNLNYTKRRIIGLL